MGHTNTAAKRDRIRSAVDAMEWVEPGRLRDVLDAAPLRFHVASLFYGRAWALGGAAITDLPDAPALFADPTDGQRRLIGLRSVTGARYVLVDLGYEVLDVLHESPAVEAVTR